MAAVRQVIEEAVDQSSRTATFLMRKTEQVLAPNTGRHRADAAACDFLPAAPKE